LDDDLFVELFLFPSSFWDQFDGDGNYWTTLPAWPQSTPMKLFLNAQYGLQASHVPQRSVYSFIFDPRSPTPTIGGNNLFGRYLSQNLGFYFHFLVVVL
jgi:predicted acyl esterase